MSKALNGAHILVTRPEQQAENLCRLIEGQGGVAVRFPTLQIVGLDVQSDSRSSHKPAETNLHIILSDYDWLIFTSTNAVNFALKANGGKIGQFSTTQVAAIGQATAKALETRGLSIGVVPETGFDSESLLAMPVLRDVAGRRILIVRGQGGREELANTLRSRGATVDYWEVYKRVVPEFDRFEVAGLLEQDKLNAVTVTSSEALQNLVIMLGEKYRNKLVTIPLVVVSDRIKRYAAGLGFMQISVAEGPSDQAILGRVMAVLNEDYSD